MDTPSKGANSPKQSELSSTSSLSAKETREERKAPIEWQTLRDGHPFDRLPALVLELAHDLRVPLTVLSGHAQLLQETVTRYGLGEEMGGSVATILKGVQRMNCMTRDLVDAARLAGGRFALQPEKIELIPFIAETLQRAEMALDVGRIESELHHPLPPLTADPARLERILINLLSNALKYSPAAAPVGLVVEPERNRIRFTVRDRGRGIAACDLPHIFDRFYQPQGRGRADSVGLGLFICRAMVEAHGGRIWVESEKGQGTSFFFTLPLVPGT